MSDKPDSQESSPNRDPNDLPGHDPMKAQAQAHDSPEGVAPAAEVVDKEPTLEERLALAEARAEEFKDLYARGQAEVQNIRRRAQDDVSKAHKFAIESFAESLLPVCDSLDMSLKLENLTMDSLKEGVQATLRQLASALEKNKVIELNPLGEKLDPNRHQAISMVPGATLEPPIATGHVVSVLQKGYLINDRLLRPALVTVAQ
jgi:molecular chaperone GrpE